MGTNTAMSPRWNASRFLFCDWSPADLVLRGLSLVSPSLSLGRLRPARLLVRDVESMSSPVAELAEGKIEVEVEVATIAWGMGARGFAFIVGRRGVFWVCRDE